jgi:chloramphenicol 3-O phosphotransferase
MKKEPLQIIYLNGPSSSGKTTLAKALQHAFEEPFLHVGIDKIIGWMPEKINNWTGGEAPLGYSWKKSMDAAGNPIQELQAGPYAQKIGKTFQEVVLALAKMGHRIVIDDVSFGKQQLDEWKKTLEGFHVLWVGVNAPLPILEQREKERGNRILGSARGQFHKVHVDASYDLEIDTHEATIGENVEKIKSLALCASHLMEASSKNLKGSPNAQRKENVYKIVVDYAPTEADNAVVREGVVAFNENILGERDKAFSIFLKNDLGKVFGGIQAFMGTESIYIDVLWVEGNLQKQGYGKKLLDTAEQEAIKNGCAFSAVDTFDFQAEEFYLKNGYKRISELKNCWFGHSKFFLRKNLS